MKLLIPLLILTATPSSGEPRRASRTAVAAIQQAFPDHLHRQAVNVARCESRLRPRAVSRRNRNGTRDWGLFQLNDGGTLQSLNLTVREALNPYVNANAAWRLYQRRGWRPWVCARKLGYR